MIIKRFTLICWLGLLLGSCNQPASPPPELADAALGTTATPTLAPTPTLVAALATSAAQEATSTRLPTATSTPTPTATPLPQQRLQLGSQALAVGNDDLAAQQFTALVAQPNLLTAQQQQQVLYDLAVSQWRNGRFADATATFTQLLAQESNNPDIQFYLGEAYAAQGLHAEAAASYTKYAASYPDMAAYIQPRIAQAHLALGDRAAAIAAYETAVSAPANRFKAVALHQTLADFYLADERYDDAIGQYDAILAIAQTEFTRGQATYLAGRAALLAGNEADSWARYETAVYSYPRAYESYQALVALVEAGREVDDYQRGLVDFYAKVYLPAVEAFERHLATATVPKNDAYLFLAWSYEALGNGAAAQEALARYAAVEPAQALLEEARLLARLGETQTAVNAYNRFLETYPNDEAAPAAAWAAAELTTQLGDAETAVSHYLTLANQYPQDNRAAEALFWAGWLTAKPDTQQTAWHQAATNYPHALYGGAAQVWLLRSTESISETVTTAIASSRAEGYYNLRARDMLAGQRPFAAAKPFVWPGGEAETAVQQEAEAWLRDRLRLAPDADVATLSPTLANDPRRQIGERLWRLGLLEEAKGELESLRQSHSSNPLFSYQLALYFRELGLYRSSIIAAGSLQTAVGQPVLALPRFIGRLLYPVYYGELIGKLAQEYGYDPRLQLALVRQESLFESFARSGAAAQGLSQVIPDTGTFIAQRLNWPDYENDDLYRPYVGLTFGAYYLDLQLDQFDDHPHAALAAYNAGPGNAARWYETAGGDLDLFVETVNFPETRLYIERIYTGFVLYRELYGE